MGQVEVRFVLYGCISEGGPGSFRIKRLLPNSPAMSLDPDRTLRDQVQAFVAIIVIQSTGEQKVALSELFPVPESLIVVDTHCQLFDLDLTPNALGVRAGATLHILLNERRYPPEVARRLLETQVGASPSPPACGEGGNPTPHPMSYQVNPSDRICRAFATAAERTWDDLATSPDILEDSITDYRLLELKRSCPREVKIFRFNRKKEAYTGADWEWWFGARGQWFGMRVQAKRLSSQSLEYAHLDYRGGRSKSLQVDQLLKSARARGIYPMYAFYNSWSPADRVDTWPCGTFDRRPQSWGVSVADAHKVRGLVRLHLRHPLIPDPR